VGQKIVYDTAEEPTPRAALAGAAPAARATELARPPSPAADRCAALGRGGIADLIMAGFVPATDREDVNEVRMRSSVRLLPAGVPRATKWCLDQCQCPRPPSI